MTPDIPDCIRAYFDGRNARDFARAASCFADGGAVADEGADHVGRAAIAAWMRATVAQFDDRAHVLSVARQSSGDANETCVVAAEVSGDFPGSPIRLRFAFTLKDGLIVRLEIAP